MAMTKEQYEQLLTIPEFKNLIDLYGIPKTSGKTCNELDDGAICMETACRNGKKLVIRCKGGEPVDYSEEDC
jgi:hypothetical protein